MPVRLIIHVAHSSARRHGGSLRLWFLGDHGFGGDEQASHRCCVLESGAYDFGGVDHPLSHEVTILSGLSIVAETVIPTVQDFADDHRAVFTSLSSFKRGVLAASPHPTV